MLLSASPVVAGNTLPNPTSLAEAPSGWWTAEMVGTLVVLGATHRRSSDGGGYPVFEWDSTPDEANQIHLLGYEEPVGRYWVYVVEGSYRSKTIRFDGEITFTTTDGAEVAYERVAAMLNWQVHRASHEQTGGVH